MQLLLRKDQYVVQALSPDTPQKAFADRIGSWRLIGYGENLDVARCCNASEIGVLATWDIRSKMRGK